MIVTLKFSTSSRSMANIHEGNPPFLLFYLSLTRLANMIDKLKILLDEYSNISFEDFMKSVDRHRELVTELTQERDNIGLELKYVNDLIDIIKLTHPNFDVERLLEYNKYYIYINKLFFDEDWNEGQGKIDINGKEVNENL